MITIREANINDASAIAYVHIGSWRENYAGLVPTDYLMNLSYQQQSRLWFDALNSPSKTNIIYVAVNDRDQIVGFASAGLSGSPHSQDYSGELFGIHLIQNYQHCGIGQQLVYEVVDHMIDLEINAMTTWVLVDDNARGFYEACGGVVVDNKAIIFAQTELWKVCYSWFDLHDFGIPMPVQAYHQFAVAVR
jgi:GNAT superfamily N-acetyltransferase